MNHSCPCDPAKAYVGKSSIRKNLQVTKGIRSISSLVPRSWSYRSSTEKDTNLRGYCKPIEEAILRHSYCQLQIAVVKENGLIKDQMTPYKQPHLFSPLKKIMTKSLTNEDTYKKFQE